MPYVGGQWILLQSLLRQVGSAEVRFFIDDWTKWNESTKYLVNFFQILP